MPFQSRRFIRLLLISGLVFFFCFAGRPALLAQESNAKIDERIDRALAPIAELLEGIMFYSITIYDEEVPIVLILLAGTAIFLTSFFGFINFRSFGLALRTVRGKYSSPSDPGEITHFQALSTALSGTVGLGNIAGVALAIGIGGPGATFWMIMLGLFGMTTKFCECTLGVCYRQIDRQGRAHGGAMYYLRDGLREHGLRPLGKVLAVLFAGACIGGALGAGNMFQINQAHAQFSETFGLFQEHGWKFGCLIAVVVGAVIIGGIVWIARVAEVLVPFMCAAYLLASFAVLIFHFSEIPAAAGVILNSAFSPEAAGGGFLGALIQGIRRGAFSNEAGFGAAPIAHSAVKTSKPASEGLVALLEPFVDTVVVCSTTALVIVVTGMWKIDANVDSAAIDAYTQPNQPARATSLAPEALLQVEQEWSKVRAQNGSEGWVLSSALVEETEKIGFFGIFSNFFKQLFTPADDLGTEAEPTVHLGDQAMALKTAPGEGTAATVPAEMPVTELEKWAQVAALDDTAKLWVRREGLNLRAGYAAGIWRTSQAFKTVIHWFPAILSVAVLLFAFSTMISWSYYGEQAVGYLTRNNKAVNLVYKLVFCLCIVAGASASLDKVVRLSDALCFAMVLPNLIGIYLLLPVVRRELRRYREHVAAIDSSRPPRR